MPGDQSQNMSHEVRPIPPSTGAEKPISQQEQVPEQQPVIETQKPVERIPEIAPEQAEKTLKIESEHFLDEAIGSLKEKLRSKKKVIKPIPQMRDAVTIQIEHIMEDGLKDAFKELTPVQQQEFKIKGEETAFQIRELLKKGKVKIKVIFKLLIAWLIMLPGVNRFFVEQEAKIKADKIISLSQK